MSSYSWQRVFQRAQEESDLSKLHGRVMEAENAIFIRMQELSSQDGSNAEARTESQEIHSALNGLLRIKTERLKWPSTGLEDVTTGAAS